MSEYDDADQSDSEFNSSTEYGLDFESPPKQKRVSYSQSEYQQEGDVDSTIYDDRIKYLENKIDDLMTELEVEKKLHDDTRQRLESTNSSTNEIKSSDESLRDALMRAAMAEKKVEKLEQELLEARQESNNKIEKLNSEIEAQQRPGTVATRERPSTVATRERPSTVASRERPVTVGERPNTFGFNNTGTINEYEDVFSYDPVSRL